jgi:2-polyprenyl-3-methyl-5-hydroxy-6-metoxy-1,4-benzoquinol methylase
MPCVSCHSADFTHATREYAACPACGLEQRAPRDDTSPLLPEVIELQSRKEHEYQPLGRRLSHHIMDYASSGTRVLDYACGTSASLREAQRHRTMRCTRVDRSPTVCAWLEQHCVENKDDEVYQECVGDAARPGHDVVLLFDVLQEVRDPSAVLRAARSAMAPGGRVLVTTHHDPGNAFHSRRFHVDDVVAMASGCGLDLQAAAERPEVDHFCLVVLSAASSD